MQSYIMFLFFQPEEGIRDGHVTGVQTCALPISHTSPDGEGGYPGNLDVSVTYTLNNDNEFSIHYEATTDKTTPLTITNHSRSEESRVGKECSYDRLSYD